MLLCWVHRAPCTASSHRRASLAPSAVCSGTVCSRSVDVACLHLRFRSQTFKDSGFNQPIGGWNTASVSTMNSVRSLPSVCSRSVDVACLHLRFRSQMFHSASAFNENIARWNMASASTMNAVRFIPFASLPGGLP
jgi:hypothetical protein